MTSLGTDLTNLTVEQGTVAVAWLGQAGFVIKSSGGTTAMIDPYLSDYAELIWGVKRAYPPVLDPAEFTPDLLLVTHWHEDHLDRPTIIAYRDNPAVILGGPLSCLVRAQGWGWPEERLIRIERGEQFTYGDVHVTATFARHDDILAEVPDAIGFLIDAGEVRIWNVADTEYDARLRPYRDESIDVMLVPINGGGGNMNAYEAGFLTWWIEPRYAVPVHYDMWTPDGFGPDATLDPNEFVGMLNRLYATAKPRIMTPGEIAIFQTRSGPAETESDHG